MAGHASFGVLVDERFPKEHSEIIRSRDQSFRGIASHCLIPFKSNLHSSAAQSGINKTEMEEVPRGRNLEKLKPEKKWIETTLIIIMNANYITKRRNESRDKSAYPKGPKY